MANEYKLSYTAQEIDEKLRKVSELSDKTIETVITDDYNNVIIIFSDGTQKIVGQLNIDVQADFLTDGGFGNLRFIDNKFQCYNKLTSQWVDIQITSDNATILNLAPQPMKQFIAQFNPEISKIELYIEESPDIVLDNQIINTVEKIIVCRKKNEIPENETDGEIILTIDRKSFGSYSSLPYIDTIENYEMGDVYYYKAFPINNMKIVSYSADNEARIKIKDYWLFGFTIDQDESDPNSMISYIEDNVKYTSAYMDQTESVFRPGSWNNIWFMHPKPCMLNYDGTVAYYLDSNNYKLKEDGTASDIADVNFEGNVMIEFPKVYWKIVDNQDNSANVYFSNKKVDEDFHCWSHIDNNGNEIDYCYMPAYIGYISDDKLRSISGVTPGHSKTIAAEVELAKANNLDPNSPIWYTEVFCDKLLIDLLLLLIGKSTDVQTVFGDGAYQATSFLRTGMGNDKGLFYGANSSSSVVKVFGIENWWGNTWRRVAGNILDNGVRKVKLTYGQSDGSTIDGYNLDGAGYVTLNCKLPTSTMGKIKRMHYTNYGFFPADLTGSSSTYYMHSYVFGSTTSIRYSEYGGYRSTGYPLGIFTGSMEATNTSSTGHMTAISCKPLKEVVV